MARGLKTVGCLRKWVVVLVLAGAVAVLSGCQTWGFYAQAIKGQYQILAHEERVGTLLADAQTPARLREQLELFEALRRFASQELKLPVNGHYRKYVDVHRPYVVWNVEAAPEFSLQPKTWWYPVVGRLSYRGYFSERGATNYAGGLGRKGYDVYVGGVEAYSTLGWFKDPVLNTFLFEPEPELAETLFHELGHQRVFAGGDTDFDEAFATVVGQEGARRWLRAKRGRAEYEEYLAQLGRTVEFTHLVMRARDQLAQLYGDEKTAEGALKTSRKASWLPAEELRQQKERILARLQEDYAELKKRWGGETEYDGWFARPVNNAQVNSIATYYDLVPGFERLLAVNGGDLERFYDGAQRLAKEPRARRHERLRKLAGEQARDITPPFYHSAIPGERGARCKPM